MTIKEIVESYKQGAMFSDSEEKAQLAEAADNGVAFPFDCGSLYRGVCTGEVHEVGDIIEVTDQNIESWSEDEETAVEFSKERGSEVSSVYEMVSGNVKGIPVDDYCEDPDNEMEWILSAGQYRVVEISDEGDYTLYTVERK